MTFIVLLPDTDFEEGAMAFKREAIATTQTAILWFSLAQYCFFGWC